MSGVGENIYGTTTDFLNLNAALVVHNGDSGHHQEGEQSNPIRDDEPDDEDPREREAFEIEKAVMQFVDEPSICHDEYPDNDSDEDEEVVRERHRNRNTYIPGDGNLYAHQTFFSGIAFKDAVLDYALKTARNIQQYRYDKDKLGYKCVGGGCVWRSSTERSCILAVNLNHRSLGGGRI